MIYIIILSLCLIDVHEDNVGGGGVELRPLQLPDHLAVDIEPQPVVETLDQCGPLSLVEVQRGSALIGPESCYASVSYAIKNQLVASKAPY